MTVIGILTLIVERSHTYYMGWLCDVVLCMMISFQKLKLSNVEVRRTGGDVLMQPTIFKYLHNLLRPTSNAHDQIIKSDSPLLASPKTAIRMTPISNDTLVLDTTVAY